MTETDDAITDSEHPPARPGEQYRNRERPSRRPVVSPKLLILAGAALLAVGLAAVALLFVQQSRTVTVPDVVGMTAGAADQALRQAGLTSRVEERRFSTQPEGTVLDQSPAEGGQTRRGSVVTLVVSQGTEEFTMPDVVGDGIRLATGRLNQLGLEVTVDVEPSDLPSDTVLSSNPAPGTTVRTGDLVRLTVATTRTVDPALQPYRLQGVVITIDPSPGLAGDTDVTLEVARRLRALLEASGAGVVVTRSGVDTSSADQTRAARAAEATPALLVGLDAPATGTGGRGVSVPAAGNATMLASARSLASAISTGLADGGAVPVASAAPDVVQRAVAAPSVRVRLGSYASREDVTDFRDPRWADTMARAIYRAIGQQFGSV